MIQCTLQEGNPADRQGSGDFAEKGLLALNHGQNPQSQQVSAKRSSFKNRINTDHVLAEILCCQTDTYLMKQITWCLKSAAFGIFSSSLMHCVVLLTSQGVIATETGDQETKQKNYKSAFMTFPSHSPTSE